MPDAPSSVSFPADGAHRLAWSPDGGRIALCGSGQLRLVDPDGGAISWQVEVSGGGSVTFSPDGRRLVTCDFGDGSVSIEAYDVAGGGRLWTRNHIAVDPGPDTPVDPNNPVGSLLGGLLVQGLAAAVMVPFLRRLSRAYFSPDSRLIAHAGLVLDAATGADALSLPVEQRTETLTVPMPPAYSRDSRTLAARTAEGITVLDTRTGNAVWSAVCPGQPVWACFVEDQLVVLCDPPHEVHHFDAATGGALGKHSLDPAFGATIAFLGRMPALFSTTQDDRSILAIGGPVLGSTTATVYQTSTGTGRFPPVKLERSEAATPFEESRGMLSPDGERFAINRPGLTVLRTRSGAIEWQEPDGAVGDVVFHPSGSRLAALVGNELRLYDTGLMAPPSSVGAPLRAVSLSGGAIPLLAAASQTDEGHGVASLFLAAQGKVVVEKRDQGLVGAAVLSPDGQRLATGRTTGWVAVYDTVSGARRLQIHHDDAVNDLGFDATGELLATAANDKTARLIDTTTGAELWRRDHERSVRRVVLDPLGRWVATACADQTTNILDISNGTITATFTHDGRVQALSVAHSRQVVAAAYEGGAVLVIDPATGTLLGQADHPRGASAAALNLMGDLLASGGRDNEVRISAVSDTTVTGNLRVPVGNEVIELLFSTSGVLAALTSDGVVRVLDPKSGDTLAWLSHPGTVSGIAFSGDGSLLAVGCEDGNAYVYPATWS
ncbi:MULTISPECIES: outer membrane protein assembly factor BamB family protein [unclassified Kribbella]|uniref:outer membrane protein assembly factor BamB family protein n=1 Tax=unclassified Kribbella TaxID=2644121 RepID=UPI003015A7A8